MSKKNDLQKLQEVQAKLEAVKSSNPEKWTDELQAKLDEVNGVLKEEQAKLDEDNNALKEEQAFVVDPRYSQNVILRVYKGNRYNEQTGKEVARLFIMNMTKSEFDRFKTYHNCLGLNVAEVLYDPYGEAEALVVK